MFRFDCVFLLRLLYVHSVFDRSVILLCRGHFKSRIGTKPESMLWKTIYSSMRFMRGALTSSHATTVGPSHCAKGNPFLLASSSNSCLERRDKQGKGGGRKRGRKWAKEWGDFICTQMDKQRDSLSLLSLAARPSLFSCPLIRTNTRFFLSLEMSLYF